MLPFGVTIPATVPQGSEIPEGLMNNPVRQQHVNIVKSIKTFRVLYKTMSERSRLLPTSPNFFLVEEEFQIKL